MRFLQALFLLKSQAQIGQGQALQCFNKKHWQNVDITILISITIFSFYAGVSPQVSVHTFSHLPQLKQSSLIEFLALAAISHLHCRLLAARVRSLSHQQTFVLTCYHTNHMSVKSGGDFSARKCWGKRQSHARKKFKEIMGWLSFLQWFLVWRI